MPRKSRNLSPHRRGNGTRIFHPLHRLRDLVGSAWSTNPSFWSLFDGVERCTLASIILCPEIVPFFPSVFPLILYIYSESFSCTTFTRLFWYGVALKMLDVLQEVCGVLEHWFVGRRSYDIFIKISFSFSESPWWNDMKWYIYSNFCFYVVLSYFRI